MKDNQRLMLLDWMRKIHQLEYAHRFESVRWSKWNYKLGIPALIIASIVGAVSGFKELDETAKNIITATGGVSAAILTGLQTFLKPQEHSEKHKSTSSVYEKLRHRIEFLLQFETDMEKIKLEVEKIRNDWNGIDALNVADSNFKDAKNRVNGFRKYPKELGFLDTIEN